MRPKKGKDVTRRGWRRYSVTRSVGKNVSGRGRSRYSVTRSTGKDVTGRRRSRDYSYNKNWSSERDVEGRDRKDYNS